jgi:hypothetical protein
MKKYFRIGILLFVLSISFYSCKKEDYTGHSKMNFTAPNVASVTVTHMGEGTVTQSGNSYTIEETSIGDDGELFDVMVTVDNAVGYDTYIDLTDISGVFSGIDYTAERVKITATETVGHGSITILKSGDIEEEETATFKVNNESPNVNGGEEFSFTVTDDYINDDFIVNFSWAMPFDHDDFDPLGVSGNYEDIDVDFLVLDSSFNDTGNYSGATGGEPEHVSFAGMPDGQYYIMTNIYDNPFSAYGFGDNIPISVSYQQDFFYEQTSFNHNLAMNSNMGTGDVGIIAVVTKENGYEYTIEPFHTCDYVLDMHDSYGDGWNGAYITTEITFGGSTMYNDYGLSSGDSGQHIIPVANGADINFYFTGGSWDSEITFEIYDPNGTLIVEAGPDPADGLLYSGNNTCP